ncbi:MAG TPA: hypothetical protein VLI06_08010 [Solimonas sp.]|nr:hypothetical protein [Solimonas sp.]
MTNRFLGTAGYAQRLASRGDVTPVLCVEHVMANKGGDLHARD